MPVDPNFIKGQVDANLTDNIGRNNNAGVVRTLLKALVDWVAAAVNGTVGTWLRSDNNQPGGGNGETVYRLGKTIFGRTTDDGSGASLQASMASIKNLNGGVSFNREFGIGPSGGTAYRFFKIAVLPASTGGSRDICRINAIMGLFGSATRGMVDIIFGNRDGFSYQYTSQGETVGCGVACYNQGGAIAVYLKIQNDFRCGSVNILNNAQVTVLDPWVEEVPSGALVFDSLNQALYPPIYAVDAANFQVNRNVYTTGFVRTGATSKGFKITGVKTGTGLTLKTGRYLELLLDDGTTVKVAEVN